MGGGRYGRGGAVVCRAEERRAATGLGALTGRAFTLAELRVRAVGVKAGWRWGKVKGGVSRFLDVLCGGCRLYRTRGGARAVEVEKKSKQGSDQGVENVEGGKGGDGLGVEFQGQGLQVQSKQRCIGFWSGNYD